MDTGKGYFKPFEKKADKPKVNEQMTFRVGEIFKIKNSRFRVEKILKKKMVLKLLPKMQK